jgi:hypothetical protein
MFGFISKFDWVFSVLSALRIIQPHGAASKGGLSILTHHTQASCTEQENAISNSSLQN